MKFVWNTCSCLITAKQIIANQQIQNVIFNMQVQAIKCMQLLTSPTVHGIECNLPFQPLNCNLIIVPYLRPPNFCRILLFQ